MKKLTFGSIIVILLIILAPCINATILTEKQSNESGRIHGSVFEASFGESPPVVLAKLVLEADGIKKTTYNGLLGGFEFKNLPVGLTYTITASHPLYHTKVYTYSLTPDKPDLEVAMNLYRKDDHSKERITNEESSGYGRVSGFVHTGGFPPYTEISGAKIVLEGDFIKRVTFSGIWGLYRFNFVEVGRQYTLTVTHPKFKTVTETFTLSADDPNLKIGITMMDNDNAKIVEISSKSINQDKNEKDVNNDDSGKYGMIIGFVNPYGFQPSPSIAGAKLVLKGGLYKKITFSGINGGFSFSFVEFGRQYTLTVTHPYYQTVTKTITISADDPIYLLGISMKDKDESKTKSEETTCLGSIYGNTGEWYIWGFSPVGLVKVEAGGKSTISSPIMGFYKIRNLPLGTYTVTGTKKGYDTCTETVTLTEGHPDKQVFIHMEPNDENINKAKTQDDKSSEEAKCFGTIFGKTSGSFEHASWMLPFVKIRTEGKTVYSGIGSRYILSGLELGYTYEIIASKPGYYTSTYHVELTAEEPYKYQNIYLMPDGYYGDMPAFYTLVRIGNKVTEAKKDLFLIDTIELMHKVHSEYPEYMKVYNQEDKE